MMWRPEGWVTKKPVNYVLHCFAPEECSASFYEAGADAMLKCIRNRFEQHLNWLDSRREHASAKALTYLLDSIADPDEEG